MRQGRLLMDALRRGVRFLTVAVRKHLGRGAFRRAAQSVMGQFVALEPVAGLSDDMDQAMIAHRARWRLSGGRAQAAEEATGWGSE